MCQPYVITSKVFVPTTLRDLRSEGKHIFFFSQIIHKLFSMLKQSPLGELHTYV